MKLISLPLGIAEIICATISVFNLIIRPVPCAKNRKDEIELILYKIRLFRKCLYLTEFILMLSLDIVSLLVYCGYDYLILSNIKIGAINCSLFITLLKFFSMKIPKEICLVIDISITYQERETKHLTAREKLKLFGTGVDVSLAAAVIVLYLLMNFDVIELDLSAPRCISMLRYLISYTIFMYCIISNFCMRGDEKSDLQSVDEGEKELASSNEEEEAYGDNIIADVQAVACSYDVAKCNPEPHYT